MTSRLCSLCGEPLPAGARADARYCSTRCRVTAHRHPNLIRPDEPTPYVTTRAFGWFVEGIVPASRAVEIAELYDQTCDSHGRVDLADDETIALTNHAGYATHLELYAPVTTLEAAEEFTAAVTEIITVDEEQA